MFYFSLLALLQNSDNAFCKLFANFAKVFLILVHRQRLSQATAGEFPPLFSGSNFDFYFDYNQKSVAKHLEASLDDRKSSSFSKDNILIKIHTNRRMPDRTAWRLFSDLVEVWKENTSAYCVYIV